MKIVYHKKFEKQFKRLIGREKQRIIKAINLFVQNPFEVSLSNHCLKGNMAGKSAISAAPDLRIIFEEFEDYTLVIFLDFGRHSRIYK